MKTNRRALFEALQVLSNVVEHKSTMAVLRCVKLEAQDNALKLVATNLEQTLTTTIPAEGELTTCINCKLLTKLAKPLSKKDESDIEIDKVGDGAVTVQASGVTSKLMTFPAEDFPVTNDSVDWEFAALWPTSQFADSLEHIIPAVSVDETRPHLCGVLLSSDGKAVSTDGHRMHVANLPSPMTSPLLVPYSAAVVLRRIIDDGGMIAISRKENQAQMRVGKWLLTTKLVEAEFPPYQQVIPSSSETRIVVETKKLVDALKRVSALSNSRNHGVTATINGVITLESSDPELGAASVVVETIENSHVGEDIIVGLNAATRHNV